MKDKKVIVLGMARSGIAAAKLLLLRGAKVYICDSKEEAAFNGALDELKAASPDTRYILQSIYPVSRAYESRGIITNAMITRANSWILSLAEEYGYPYLDSFSCLIGKDGYAPAALMLPDGFHPNKAGLTLVLEYIRTHAALETEKN